MTSQDGDVPREIHQSLKQALLWRTPVPAVEIAGATHSGSAKRSRLRMDVPMKRQVNGRPKPTFKTAITKRSQYRR
jgi:hypothetical protein